MDKKAKKKLRKEWREQQRAAAHAAFPMPVDDLKAMFDYLDAELPRRGCNHTRCLTQHWLEQGSHPVQSVLAWLDENSGFCDCEVLANCEQAFEEAIRR